MIDGVSPRTRGGRDCADKKELVEELLEKRIQQDDQLRLAYLEFSDEDSASTGLDPIFIKNLENVQGDERDVILIGFTYGPDPGTRRVNNRFGPIAGNGGWRRLNVLFTRARKRIHVFSSMRPEDVRLDNIERNRGAVELRQYLEFAATSIMPDFGKITGRGADSEFEEAVAMAISALGMTPHFQIGVEGFRIDIGVLDPRSKATTYLCGIECDGATYHSHPVARDRDRLREEILISRGWKIHRIWSTDWFKNRSTEIERMKKYFQELLA